MPSAGDTSGITMDSSADALATTIMTPNINHDAPLPAQRPRDSSIIRELAIVSLIIAPLALLPILTIRHGLRRISSQVHEITALQAESLRASSTTQLIATQSAARDRAVLEATRMDLMKHKTNAGMRLGNMGKEVQALRKGLEEARSRTEVEDLAKEDAQAAKREVVAMRNDLKAMALAVNLVAKGKNGVGLSPQTLDEMASSLVDIAAFIEEVETLEGLERKGSDPRGIEKIRKLALKLHTLAGSPPQPQ
ncbi:hypothetical protein FRB98_002551, partial [Tulasnella sp. 332]